MSSVVKGRFAYKRLTQTAGTVITQVVEPKMNGSKAIITRIAYLCGATAHTLIVLKALAKTVATAAQVATDTAITVASKAFRGDNVAASDYIVVRHTDGTYGAYLVSAVSTLTFTIPALAAAVAINSPVWIMGAVGETEHINFNAVASVLNQFGDPLGGLASGGYRSVSSGTVYQRSGNDDPLIVYSANGTNAGVFESISGIYGNL